MSTKHLDQQMIVDSKSVYQKYPAVLFKDCRDQLVLTNLFMTLSHNKENAYAMQTFEHDIKAHKCFDV